MAAPFLRWQLPDSQIRLRLLHLNVYQLDLLQRKDLHILSFSRMEIYPMSPLGLFRSEAISFFVTLLIKSGNPTICCKWIAQTFLAVLLELTCPTFLDSDKLGPSICLTEQASITEVTDKLLA